MEWKHYKMDELIEEISMGPFGSDVKKEFYVDNGVPILNGSNLQGFKLQEDSFGYLIKEKADSLKKCNAHRGDIIVTHRGTLGQIVYVPVNSKYDRYVISQSQFRFRCKADLVDVQYLVYYFHTREGQYKILANASQVGVPALARATSTFRLIDIKLPPLNDQRRIASILSSLDRKIELNNKINADLEEMAQAIFKNWFVDFEPFKDGKFVDSELGMIPEGWKVGKITDIDCLITDYVSNGSFASLKQNVHLYEKKEYAQFIRNTDLKTNTFSVYVDKHSYDFLSKSTLYGNEIIISNVGDVGSVHLCPKLDIPMTLGNNIIMLRPNDKEYNYFLYLWFKYFSGQGLIQGIKGGSAQPKFNKTDFKNLPLLIPSFEIIERSYWIFESIFSILSSNVKENSRLSLLRDTLLPRLMSGELEVPE